MNKEINAREGRPASPRAVGKTLKTEPEWVMRCMEAYGRVPSERSRIADSDREALERAMEEGRAIEPDEDDVARHDEERQKTREIRELKARQKKLAEQQREFDESGDFTFPLDKY